jgi:2-methylisocitrate lyase-like PEP mutase family enzyme
MSEHGKTPLLSRDEIAELGYAIALYPSSTLFAAAESARAIAELLLRDGTTRNGLDRILEFGAFNELVGLSAWQAEEERAAR